MPDLLLISPDYDEITHSLREWANDLGYSAVRSGTHTWAALVGADVTLANVNSRLAAAPAAVFFYGHGEADRLIANDGSTAAIDSTNLGHLAGVIVLAVACDSARSLGPAAVRLGARAFVGYDYQMFVVWGTHEQRFRRAANAAPLSVVRISGASCGLGVAEAKRLYYLGSDYYVYGPGSGEYNGLLAAGWLRANASALVVIGDANASL